MSLLTSDDVWTPLGLVLPVLGGQAERWGELLAFDSAKHCVIKGLIFLFRRGQLYRELRDPMVHEVLFRCKSNPLSAVLCKRLCPGMPIEFLVYNNILGLFDQYYYTKHLI